MPDMQHIKTEHAPAAIGPYSQAVRAGEWLFVSGQIGLDPQTGGLAGEDVAVQTERVLANLRAVLEAAGGGLRDVVKCTVYLKDLAAFGRVNEVYGRHFGEPAPARAAMEVARLPKDALVEIDAVAWLPG